MDQPQPSTDAMLVDPVMARSEPLRGRGLRFVLLDELMRRRSMTVREMAAMVEGVGFELGGRASKVISDALRWEVRRGRVSRLSRGLYRFDHAPVSTIRRIKLFADHCHRWVVATRRTGSPPPVPPNRRPGPNAHRARPGQPPWAHLGWLWTM